MTVTDLDSLRPPVPQRDGKRRRRKAVGPDWVVPEAEFTSYYGQNIVKPAPWEEEIAIYLFFGGMAAGSGLIGAGADITHRHSLRRVARIAGLGSLGIGATALVIDLGRPERFLNMMRTAKLTSPMSVGSWILTGFSVFTGGAAALEIIQPWLPRESWWRELVDVSSIFASAGAAAGGLHGGALLRHRHALVAPGLPRDALPLRGLGPGSGLRAQPPAQQAL